ncbi:cellobiose-specific PTS, IIC component [Streptococcus equinus]|nr:cellobiose-specific PTS, IIC component [Streptococcus equinus]
MHDNLDAYKAGEHIPHIISKPFMETFTVGLGGSVMTLAVVIIMAFIMKKKQYRDVGRLALGAVSLTLMSLLSLVCQSF